jgi:hypothetical protein
MPVSRFRTFDEARRALWMKPGSPELARTVAWVWAFAWELAGRPVQPRGLKKFRTIQEANADRERWETDHCRSLRRRRLADSADRQG